MFPLLFCYSWEGGFVMLYAPNKSYRSTGSHGSKDLDERLITTRLNLTSKLHNANKIDYNELEYISK